MILWLQCIEYDINSTQKIHCCLNWFLSLQIDFENRSILFGEVIVRVHKFEQTIYGQIFFRLFYNIFPYEITFILVLNVYNLFAFKTVSINPFRFAEATLSLHCHWFFSFYQFDYNRSLYRCIQVYTNTSHRFLILAFCSNFLVKFNLFLLFFHETFLTKLKPVLTNITKKLKIVKVWVWNVNRLSAIKFEKEN